uniref:1-(5-phosphoribosyl)-5-((5-phosphoribosylamino)methylideneamino)imidazole-4-carboxamideisomerase n=1 Tax=Cyanothece sp. (strain PCC 7425 / ATCC 29141) TaxID=395961 RepID=B8HVG9_CYAP4
MEIIPALKIMEGFCCHHRQPYRFNCDPVAMAEQWANQGATRLHLIDCNGVTTGAMLNLPTIAAIVQQVKVPVQVEGTIYSRAQIETLFAIGVDRVVVDGSIGWSELVADLCEHFSGKIMVNLEAYDGRVACSGELTGLLATTLAERAEAVGAAGIIYTDIARQGSGIINLKALKHLADRVNLPIIAGGGASSIAELLRLFNPSTPQIVGMMVYSTDMACSILSAAY